MMTYRFKKYLGLLFCLSALLSGQMVDAARATTIRVATDLTLIAQQAAQERLPILLMVSQKHCPYCSLLKNEVLNPMILSGDYQHRVVITEILIDEDQPIKGFDGVQIRPSVVSAKYNTWVTPTLLFLDHQGREVHKRMVGVNTVEMFGYYLDESLDAALKAVRKGQPYAYKVSRQDLKE